MQTNVSVAALKETLRENREQHHTLYEEAVETYKVKARETLERRLSELESGELVAVRVMLPFPEEHLKDYDRVIRMLDMTVDETIELNDVEVAQYVLDEWGWAQSFASNTVAYTGHA